MSRAIGVIVGVVGALAIVGCWTLGASFDDIASGTVGDAAIGGGGPDGGSADAGGIDGDAPRDAGARPDVFIPPDAAPVAESSCLAIKQARPSSPDGFYALSSVDVGQRVTVYCDMTTDDGGWMLVTPAMTSGETVLGATLASSFDSRGGLIVRVYANEHGCSETSVHSRHYVMLAPQVPWTRVRFRERFAGFADCWSIFGGVDFYYPLPHNTSPFDPSLDLARDAKLMGGGTKDAFSGRLTSCDNLTDNFWSHASSGAERSILVSLRRNSASDPAGLATVADCLDDGPAMTSPTWWEYSDVFVR